MRFTFLAAALVVFFRAECRTQAGDRDLQAERALERKCLDCHNNPALHGARATGELRSVYVETERYRKSVHFEKDCTCLSCHPGATAGFHPREGVKIESCGSCHDHEDELADFRRSRHGVALAEGTANAPDCFSCHSNHYTRRKTDPEARVHPQNVASTCGKCHEAEAGAGSAGSWWAGGRLSAHGKRDLSEAYTTRICTRCHFGPDAHKTPPEGEIPECASCHDRSGPSEDGGRLMGTVHLDAFDPHGLWLAARTAGAWTSVAAFALLLGSAALFGLRRRFGAGNSGQGGGGADAR